MVHTFNLNTQKAETGRSVSLRPAWSRTIQKGLFWGAGEMSQQLTALVALPGDLGPIPSMHGSSQLSI